MKPAEIINFIEKTAPLHLAAPWDSAGMQVATLRAEIRRLAVCLDPTPATVGQAVDIGAEFILSHHPLLMKGRLPAVADSYHTVLSQLFQHGAGLYAAHTSLDINAQGPAAWLASELHLSDCAILEVTGALPNGSPCGFGMMGTLPEAMDMPSLMQTLKQHIKIDDAAYCGNVPARIRRVALCTGSGASLAPAAKALGADIFITGDVKYHAALETPLCMLDVGHHSLEEEMMRRFAQQLEKTLLGVDVRFIPSASPFHPVCGITNR